MPNASENPNRASSNDVGLMNRRIADELLSFPYHIGKSCYSLPMMKSTMSSKGQLTVPLELRERLGLEAGTVIQFEFRDGAIFMRKGTQADHPVDRLYGTLHL